MFVRYQRLGMAAPTEVNGTTKESLATKVPAVSHPLAGEPTEIASNINFHAKYSPHFSPFKFEVEQAYCATAESVRDRLIQVYSLLWALKSEFPNDKSSVLISFCH